MEEEGSTLVSAPARAARVAPTGNIVVTLADPARGAADDAAFDAMTLEVLWTRIISVVDEAAKAIVRTSFSTLSNEANDFACVLTDARGYALAQNTRQHPVVHRHPARHRAPLPARDGRRARCGPATSSSPTTPGWAPGHMSDVVAGQADLPPRRGASSPSRPPPSHMPDIGGRVRAIEARELFEEGLHIPLTWLVAGGAARRDAARAHPRQRAHPRPDRGRHLGAGRRQRADGARGCARLLDDYGLDGLDAARRRAVRARRARDARGDPRGARRHLPLRAARPTASRSRIASRVALTVKPATRSSPTTRAPRPPSRAPSTACSPTPTR